MGSRLTPAGTVRTFIAVVGTLGVAAACLAADAADLAIRRITLYRSGVGAFERRGEIDGTGEVTLRFPTEQINDILKTMFVLDKTGGVEGIRYGSKEPLARRLASFGIDIADAPSAEKLLARLRGTKVRVTTGEGPVTGTVVNVEMRRTVFGSGGPGEPQSFELPWINLLTDKGVRCLNLSQMTGFELVDGELSGELQRALAAVAEYRADRTKTVEVGFSGTQKREVVLGYVHEMPVWKTSYRLILPESPKSGAAAPDAKGTLQGWALVENTTDEDWNSVALSLVSGRPVSFQMDLYEPLFVERPTVPVPTMAGVAPRVYGGAELALERAKPGAVMAKGKAMADRGRGGAGGGFGGGGSGGGVSFGAAPSNAESMEYLSARMAEDAPDAAASGIEVGEVFQYALSAPITLERQKSAMLPILTAAIPARRVSIFSAGDGLPYPMRGVELTNASGLQLIPGPIAVFDGASYAGDAQVGHVPAGDKRLLAYAVDLDVEVSTAGSDQQVQVQKMRIVRGVFEQTMKLVTTNAFLFSNKDENRGRTMVVEVPRDEGWSLVEPKEPSEKTPATYRFELEIAAHKATPFKVVQELVQTQTIAFADMPMPQILEFHQQGRISDAVLKACNDAGVRRQAIEETKAALARAKEERERITQDQARVRQNMTTVGQSSEIYARYLQKFTEQENTLEALETQTKKLQADQARMESDLAKFLAELSVE
ncbi:MAG: hypothetical protein U0625_07340 [Phycisphaerales bacterium]